MNSRWTKGTSWSYMSERKCPKHVGAATPLSDPMSEGGTFCLLAILWLNKTSATRVTGRSESNLVKLVPTVKRNRNFLDRFSPQKKTVCTLLSNFFEFSWKGDQRTTIILEKTTTVFHVVKQSCVKTPKITQWKITIIHNSIILREKQHFKSVNNRKLVSWGLEPGQPQRITSGLNTNFAPSPSYSFHKSSYHKSCLLSLFIFRRHSTREPACGRVTYFILRAYMGTMR